MNDQRFVSAASGSWKALPAHRHWLMARAEDLFDFFQQRTFNPKGGFFDLDPAGRPLNADNPIRPIHTTARMVHCFVIGSLLGRSEDVVQALRRYESERSARTRKFVKLGPRIARVTTTHSRVVQTLRTAAIRWLPESLIGRAGR